MVEESEFKDEIKNRLESASPVELDRMREFLKLKPSSSINDIINEYRLSAGNSFVNVGRRWDLINKITYEEILVDVIEKIRPVEEDLQDYFKKVGSVFSRKGSLKENSSEFTTEELEVLLLGIANKKIKNALKNMSDDNKMMWQRKAKNEMDMSATNASNKAHSPVLSNSYTGTANIVGSILSMAVSRGVVIVAGGTVAAFASAILIPAIFSGPAYRKTVNATLELIMIGRRQAAEVMEP